MTVSRSAVLTGKQLAGRYQVGMLLGDGGMGRVYEAVQISTGREVAVKVLDTRRSDTEAINRFESEARTTAALAHPNTIRVLDFGLSGGMFFIVLEYLRGFDLADLVRGPARSSGLVAHVLRQIASSLAEAHEKGIVHRDIKPSNVMLERYHGQPCFVKVIDFGIARHEQGQGNATIGILGTQGYMAPEYIGHGKLDVRSDLYSLGCVGYELLCSRLPYAGIDAKSTPMAALEAHLSAEAIPISDRRGDVDREFGALIMRLLSKNPDDRPRSATELVPALWEIERRLGADLDGEMNDHGLSKADPGAPMQRTEAYASGLAGLVMSPAPTSVAHPDSGAPRLMPAGLPPPIVATPTPAPEPIPPEPVDSVSSGPGAALADASSLPAPVGGLPSMTTPPPGHAQVTTTDESALSIAIVPESSQSPVRVAPPASTPPAAGSTPPNPVRSAAVHPPVAGRSEPRAPTPEPAAPREEWKWSGDDLKSSDITPAAEASRGPTWGVALVLAALIALGWYLVQK